MLNIVVSVSGHSFPAIRVIRHITDKISSYTPVMVDSLVSEINNIYTKLVQSGDAEKYYESYYSKIITSSQNWIENLDQSVAALAFKKLGGKKFPFSQNPQQTCNSTHYRYRERCFTISVRICCAQIPEEN